MWTKLIQREPKWMNNIYIIFVKYMEDFYPFSPSFTYFFLTDNLVLAIFNSLII